MRRTLRNTEPGDRGAAVTAGLRPRPPGTGHGHGFQDARDAAVVTHGQDLSDHWGKVFLKCLIRGNMDFVQKNHPSFCYKTMQGAGGKLPGARHTGKSVTGIPKTGSERLPSATPLWSPPLPKVNIMPTGTVRYLRSSYPFSQNSKKKKKK